MELYERKCFPPNFSNKKPFLHSGKFREFPRLMLYWRCLTMQQQTEHKMTNKSNQRKIKFPWRSLATGIYAKRVERAKIKSGTNRISPFLFLTRATCRLCVFKAFGVRLGNWRILLWNSCHFLHHRQLLDSFLKGVSISLVTHVHKATKRWPVKAHESQYDPKWFVNYKRAFCIDLGDKKANISEYFHKQWTPPTTGLVSIINAKQKYFVSM